MTESLRLKGEGKYIPQSWEELLRPAASYDAEAVVDSVIERGGLVVK